MKQLKILILIICSNTTILFSQDYLTIFNKGLQELNKKEFNKALSLFNNAITIKNESEAIYNRAVCKYYLQDTIGFCTDILLASYLGDYDALSLLNEKCYDIETIKDLKDTIFLKRKPKYNGEIDTIEINKISKDTLIYTRIGNQKVYKTTSIKPIYTIYNYIDAGGVIDLYGEKISKDSSFIPYNKIIFGYDIQNPTDLIKYISYLVIYPEQAKSREIHGTVIIRCIVDENGKINFENFVMERDIILNICTKSIIEKIGPFIPAYISNNRAVKYEIVFNVKY